MKGLSWSAFSLCCLFFTSGRPALSGSSIINPTGTYILKGNIRGNRIMGHFGEIRVKLLTTTKIAICFYINTGYPDYHSGSFLDTLAYQDDLATYLPRQSSGCSILFCFAIKEVETQQIFTDPRSNCGFGTGVMASTIFNKYSMEIPVIQDLSRNE
jgi:hypothetical protein